MKIKVFTITCNRLEQTKKWLPQLKEKVGYDFEHIIFDNGSTDGTLDYLNDNGYTVLSSEKNVGIHPAMQICIDLLSKDNPDLIIKYDNDCEILTPFILKRIVEFYEKNGFSYISAPFDFNIPSNLMPREIGKQTLRNFSQRTHVGGIFKVMPLVAAEMLLTNNVEHGDLFRGRFWTNKGFKVGYLMDLQIKHKGIGKQTKSYTL